MLTGDKNALTLYFLYIFQTTSTIIIKISVSNFLSVFDQQNQKLENLLFVNSTGYNPFMGGVNKIYTFLYVKIFFVSVGLFVSYLILECLCLHMAQTGPNLQVKEKKRKNNLTI